jgi:hypothetical protein
MLEDSRFLLRPISEFNDPYEFLPTFKRMTRKELERFLLRLENDGWYFVPNGKLSELARSERRKLLSHLYQKQADLSEQMAKVYVERIARGFRVLCLCEDPGIVLMWSHYSEEHRGFAVGFDADAIKSAAKAEYLDVNYAAVRPTVVQDWNSISDSDNHQEVVRLISSKGSQWAYEKEKRLLIFREAVEFDGDSIFLRFPVNAVRRIILGLRCKPETAATLGQIRANKYPHAELCIASHCADPDRVAIHPYH